MKEMYNRDYADEIKQMIFGVDSIMDHPMIKEVIGDIMDVDYLILQRSDISDWLKNQTSDSLSKKVQFNDFITLKPELIGSVMLWIEEGMNEFEIFFKRPRFYNESEKLMVGKSMIAEFIIRYLRMFLNKTINFLDSNVVENNYFASIVFWKPFFYMELNLCYEKYVRLAEIWASKRIIMYSSARKNMTDNNNDDNDNAGEMVKRSESSAEARGHIRVCDVVSQVTH